MFNPVGRVFWLILSLHILLNVESFAQRKEYQFTHRSTDIGLSNSSIICILEDRKGFIWIGSHIGINKYDGYNLITYKNRLGDSTSITANFIRDLLEDREGNL